MKSFKKFVVESIEQEELDEAVEVSHDRYMRSHGKKASGGHGMWMFTHKRMGDANLNDPKEVHSASGKFSDAKKSAQQWAKKHGHSAVYVMEEVELDESFASNMNKAAKKAHAAAAEKIKKMGPVTRDTLADINAKLGNTTKKEEVELDEVSASTLRSYVDKARTDKSRQQKARTVAKNDYKKYGIPSDKERADAAHSKASQRNTGISMAKRKLGGYTKGTEPKVLAREEVDLDEAKLSSQQRDRLDDLILNVHMTTHPEYDGEETPGKYLKAIEKEFGASVAKQVKDGIEITHWGRDNRSGGNDKLSWRKGGARITKSGKMNKQDVEALKNRIKRDKQWGGITKKVKLPEEVELDEVSQELANRVAKKRQDQALDLRQKAADEPDMSKSFAHSRAANKASHKAGQTYTRMSRKSLKDIMRKEEVELDEVSDKKLDAYRQKAFADQPSGDDGSDKYRKRKFGRDLAFAKQTGRAKVLATKEEVELDEKLKASDDMGTWVKDFQKSDAPQFKGKSQKKRQQMAIAAKLAAERNEEVELEEGPIKAIGTAFKKHGLRKAIRKTAADREQMIRQSKTNRYPDYADEYEASLAKRDELKKQLKSLSKKEEVELDEKLAAHTVRGDTYVGVPDRVVAQAKDKVKKMNPSTASDHQKAMNKVLSDMGWEMTAGGKYVREEVNESNDMKMVRIGQKMLDLAPKEKNDMISNAYSKLGDALTRYGTNFGPKNVKDLEKKTGLNQRIIMDLIKRAQQ